jgi:hypothetical protein
VLTHIGIDIPAAWRLPMDLETRHPRSTIARRTDHRRTPIVRDARHRRERRRHADDNQRSVARRQKMMKAAKRQSL